MKLVFEKPSASEPGFLRRARRALEFQELITQNPGPDLLDELVAFLADYVVEPNDRAQAIEALWEASEEQFKQLLQEVAGGNPTNPTD